MIPRQSNRIIEIEQQELFIIQLKIDKCQIHTVKNDIDRTAE